MSLVALLLLLLSGCEEAECARGDYSAAECRVVAEQDHARTLTSTGAEVRFQEPDAQDASTWQPLGLVQEVEPGRLRLRPATLMDFAVSVDPGQATELSIVLDNVAADTVISVGPLGQEAEVPLVGDPRLSRSLELVLGTGTTWIRGRRPCPPAYRLVAAGDVQTNPSQFERLVEDLHRQVDEGEAAGQPLLGFLLLGDLAQEPTDEQFGAIEDILVGSPVPVSVVPGNHDVYADPYALYNRWFGPGNFAFDVCRTRVALLDTGGGDLAPSVEARLPELLDKGDADFLVGATHYPPYAERTGAGFRDSMQATYLLSEAARNGMDRLVTGHVHYWAEFPSVSTGQGPIHQVISGTAGATQGSGNPHFGVTQLRFTDAVETCFSELLVPGRGEASANSAVPIDRCVD